MNLKLIKKLASLNKKQLQSVMTRYLKGRGYQNIINTNMYLIAEGDLPICLCAHMDTVFSKPPTTFYYDQEQTVLWSPQGLGADDRAGSYALINLIQKGYKPSIILTDMEERGGIGASDLIKRYPECPFKDCRALIQLDRRGEKDSVYYECDNKDFEELINSYGFETEWGTFTDISIFGPQWGIAAVNLSIGYDNEHREIETLNMTHLHSTIDKVEKMLKDCGKWLSYAYIPAVYKTVNGIDTAGLTYGDDFWWVQDKCICCGKHLNPGEGHLCQATEKPGDDFLVCDECHNAYFDPQYFTDLSQGPQDG
jgi:hypothetical protein